MRFFALTLKSAQGLILALNSSLLLALFVRKLFATSANLFDRHACAFCFFASRSDFFLKRCGLLREALGLSEC